MNQAEQKVYREAAEEQWSVVEALKMLKDKWFRSELYVPDTKKH